jgi:hypothetical protein
VQPGTRRPVGAPQRLGAPGLGAGTTGMFREQQVAPPGDVNKLLTGGLIEQTLGWAAASASDTTRRTMRTYAAGMIAAPQRFVRGPMSPNSDEVLELAPLIQNSRTALSRNRGLAPGA